MFIPLIQTYLQEKELDGWLLFDFQHANSFFWQVLNLPPDMHITRRIFYWIPKEGNPVKIVHKVESHVLDHLAGELQTYVSASDLLSILSNLYRNILKNREFDKEGSQHFCSEQRAIAQGQGASENENSEANQAKAKTDPSGCFGIKGRIAMEYSKTIPYLSKVDGGTVDLLRSLGFEIVSSAEILQKLTSRLTQEELDSHRRAAEFLSETADAAFLWIQENLKNQKTVFEKDVRDFILEAFEREGFFAEDPPIVARGVNSANPHYAMKGRGDLITPGDFVLIDLWCKEKKEGSIYADITRVAVFGKPTKEMLDAFQSVRGAQEMAVSYLKSNNQIKGSDIDTLCRNFLEARGFKENVLHRTGHSIGSELHFSGAHFDSFETIDDRTLLPNTCYSIEPAVYLPGKFGLRLEHDVVLGEDGEVYVTGGVQSELPQLL